MMRKLWLIQIFITLIALYANGQNKLVVDGQLSIIGSYSPEVTLNTFLGARYIPELGYGVKLDSTKTIDFEASINLSGSVLFHPFDTGRVDGNINPYRIWARYTGKQFELRLGLQKIDFGSATLLRPIQWFNQIDARDPLQLTNGVYGALSRFYFLNNANVWFWVLYQNEEPRGFDVVRTNKKYPEAGGRLQLPVPRGELALSYHYRTANSTKNFPLPAFSKIPENRIGLDGKWDVEVGLWFEAAFIHKSKDLGSFTNQTLLNLGTDYTFSIGNGLNVIAEHLITSFDQELLEFKSVSNITATSLSYPIGFYDNLSTVFYYNWTTQDLTFFLNYEHQFKHITGYVMLYYNPASQQGIQQNELVNSFSGPGIRLMIVYNH